MPKNNFSRARRQAKSAIDQEIEALARAGLLHEELGLPRACELANEAIEQAVLWGQWYEARQQSRQSAKSAHKDRGDACRRLERRLASFVWRYAQHPPAGVDPLSFSFITHARALFEEFDRIVATRASKARAGNPSNPWLLGFIWGMAVGWRQLTFANIGSVGRFPRFVQAGLDMAAADKGLTVSETLVKTAIARFRMRERAWLRPVVGGGKNEAPRAPNTY
jgi:hypothetical protein